MSFDEKIKEIKVFYTCFLDMLENDATSEENFKKISKIIQNHNFILNNHEFEPFLNLIHEISQNHYRSPTFFEKIFRILTLLLDDMKQIYSNFTIFHKFRKNKRILLFLIEKRILTIDSDIINILQENKYYILRKYSKYLDIDKKHTDDPEFTRKQHIGENDNLICKLIRDDSINEFIEYINKNSIQIDDYVCDPTEFETNPYFFKKRAFLLDYAAFFGSIQIIKYLLLNNVKPKPLIWEFAVHSNNAEIIHLLEEKCDKRDISSCLKESIKCHHNDFAYYFQSLEDHDKNNDSKLFLNGVKYCNYQFYPTYFIKNENLFDFFILAIKCDYSFLVEKFLSLNKIDLNRTINRKIKNMKLELSKRERVDEIIIENEEIKNEFPYHISYKVNNFPDYFIYRDCEENATALYVAIEENSNESAKLLLNRNDIDVNQKCVIYDNIYKEEKTVLHVAINNRNFEIVKILCQHPKIDVNLKLDRFARKDYKNRFRYRTLEINHYCLIEKIPPIYLAIHNQHNQIVSILSEHQGIKINEKYIFEAWDLTNIYKQFIQRIEYNEVTPLDYAVNLEKLDICESLLSNKDIDINCETIDYFTLEKDDEKMTSKLIKRRLVPLHSAILLNKSDILELLLSNRTIDINHLYVKEFIHNDYNDQNLFYSSVIEKKKQTKTPLYLVFERYDVNLKIIYLLTLNYKNTVIDEEGLVNYIGLVEDVKPKSINKLQGKWMDLNDFSNIYRMIAFYKDFEDENIKDDFNYKKTMNTTITVLSFIENENENLSDFEISIKRNKDNISAQLIKKIHPIDYISDDILFDIGEEKEFREEEEEFDGPLDDDK